MLTPKLTVREFDRNLLMDYEVTLAKAGFHYLGRGAYRTAYRRNNIVIKLPQSYIGLLDNIYEAYAYRKYRMQPGPNDEVYAPCRLLANSCLMMVYVQRMLYGEMPDWAGHIDGSQVGFYHGRAVVYDSACDVAVEDQHAAKKWVGI